MEILIAVTVGSLIAVGLFLLLRRNAFFLLAGLVILSHGVNLLVFASGGLRRDATPIVPEGRAAADTADPLPQALVLTAIVIGLGVQTFVLTLIYRLIAAMRSADLRAARVSEGDQVR